MWPFLFDVATMLGLPIIGEDIPPLYDEGFEDPDYPVSKENIAYGKYMNKYRWE